MKLGKARTLVLIVAIAAAFLLAGHAVEAALLGIQITVQLDTGGGFVTQGTAAGGAAGGSTALIVTASAGNTLRFIVQYDSSATYNGYATTIAADDPTEIDFVNGSGTDLSGKGFAGFAGGPNNSLNDASPESGNGNSAGSGTVTTQDLYRVDYLVTGPITDALGDFTVNLTAVGTGNTLNTAAREASVRVDAGAAILPEPSTLLLLGSGLAALAGLVRRKR